MKRNFAVVVAWATLTIGSSVSAAEIVIPTFGEGLPQIPNIPGLRYCAAPDCDNSAFENTHFGIDNKTGKILAFAADGGPMDIDNSHLDAKEEVLLVIPNDDNANYENKFVPPEIAFGAVQQPIDANTNYSGGFITSPTVTVSPQLSAPIPVSAPAEMYIASPVHNPVSVPAPVGEPVRTRTTVVPVVASAPAPYSAAPVMAQQVPAHSEVANHVIRRQVGKVVVANDEKVPWWKGGMWRNRKNRGGEGSGGSSASTKSRSGASASSASSNDDDEMWDEEEEEYSGYNADGSFGKATSASGGSAARGAVKDSPYDKPVFADAGGRMPSPQPPPAASVRGAPGPVVDRGVNTSGGELAGGRTVDRGVNMNRGADSAGVDRGNNAGPAGPGPGPALPPPPMARSGGGQGGFGIGGGVVDSGVNTGLNSGINSGMNAGGGAFGGASYGDTYTSSGVSSMAAPSGGFVSEPYSDPYASSASYGTTGSFDTSSAYVDTAAYGGASTYTPPPVYSSSGNEGTASFLDPNYNSYASSTSYVDSSSYGSSYDSSASYGATSYDTSSYGSSTSYDSGSYGATYDSGMSTISTGSSGWDSGSGLVAAPSAPSAPPPPPAYRASGPSVDAQGSPQFENAVRLVKENRFSEAKNLLSSETSRNPSNAAAWRWLADCHYNLLELDEAVDCYQRSLERDPNDYYALRGQGFAYLHRGHEYWRLMQEEVSKGSKEKAAETFANAHDNYKKSLEMLGLCLRRAPTDGEAVYGEAMAAEGASRKLYSNAISYLKLGPSQRERAELFAENCITVINKGIERAKERAKQNPGDAGPRALLGGLYLRKAILYNQLGKNEQALIELRNSRDVQKSILDEIDKNNTTAKRNLSECESYWEAWGGNRR